MTLTASPRADNSWRVDAIAGLVLGAEGEEAHEKPRAEAGPPGDGRGG